MTLRHPRSKHWHQLYMILAKKSSLGSFIHSRSYHSADCDIDHGLVREKVKLKLCERPQGGTNKLKTADVKKLQNPGSRQELSLKFLEGFQTNGMSSDIESVWQKT